MNGLITRWGHFPPRGDTDDERTALGATETLELDADEQCQFGRRRLEASFSRALSLEMVQSSFESQ